MTPAVQAELTNLIAVEDRDESSYGQSANPLNEIEHFVGRYRGMAILEPRLPRDAGLKRELRRFLARGDFSPAAFRSLYPWLQKDFRDQGIDTDCAHLSSEAVRIAGDAIMRSRSAESRGRPRRGAFRDLIKQLRGVYRRYGCSAGGEDEASQRYRQGAMAALSLSEADELEFVTLILRDAGIHVPGNLRKLFLDIGRPTHERVELLNRIARRSQKYRQRRDKLKA